MAAKSPTTTAAERLGVSPENPDSLEATAKGESPEFSPGSIEAPAPLGKVSPASEEDIQAKIDSAARKIMQSLNPSFFEKQKDFLKDDPNGPDLVPPAVTTLFASEKVAVQIVRVLGLGTNKCKLPKDLGETRPSKGEFLPNPYALWLRGSATPTPERNVPIVCIVTRDKGDEKVATFTLP